MARPITITTKGLKQLQKQFKYMETTLEPQDLKPVLADALMLIKTAALRNLRAKAKGHGRERKNWEHIEDALTVQKGKSNRIATAFCKVFRKRAPQAHWFEFGTVKQPARAFFRPAVDEQRAAVRKAIERGIKSLLMRQKFEGASPDDTGWVG